MTNDTIFNIQDPDGDKFGARVITPEDRVENPDYMPGGPFADAFIQMGAASQIGFLGSGIFETGRAVLTRKQATELHAFLGKHLGLGIPTPRSPLTASRPAEGAAKASRNRETYDEQEARVLGQFIERPNGSGDAATEL